MFVILVVVGFILEMLFMIVISIFVKGVFRMFKSKIIVKSLNLI